MVLQPLINDCFVFHCLFAGRLSTTEGFEWVHQMECFWCRISRSFRLFNELSQSIQDHHYFRSPANGGFKYKQHRGHSTQFFVLMSHKIRLIAFGKTHNGATSIKVVFKQREMENERGCFVQLSLPKFGFFQQNSLCTHASNFRALV